MLSDNFRNSKAKQAAVVAVLSALFVFVWWNKRKDVAFMAHLKAKNCYVNNDLNCCIRWYGISLFLSPASHSYYNRALAYAKLSKWENVVKDSSKAIELEPDNIDQRRLRAEAYLKGNDWKKAIDDLNKITELDPSDKKTAYYLAALAGYAYGYNGKFENFTPPQERLKKYEPSTLLRKILEHRKREGSEKLQYYSDLAILEEQLAIEMALEIKSNSKLNETLLTASTRAVRGPINIIRDFDPKDHALFQYLLNNQHVFDVYYESGAMNVRYLWEKRLDPVSALPEGKKLWLEWDIKDFKQYELPYIDGYITGESDSIYDDDSVHDINVISKILGKYKNTELNNDSLKIVDLYAEELERLKVKYKDKKRLVEAIDQELQASRSLRKKYSAS